MGTRQIRMALRFVLAAVVVVLLAAVLYTPALSPNKNAARKVTMVILERTRTAIGQYETDKDELPVSLDALLPSGEGWAASRGYVRSTETFLDAWGTRLRYVNLTNTFHLRSAGRDRLFDTKDDIVAEAK